MTGEITFGLAFMLGMASFLSPCVLPVVPAYLSLISGMSFDEMREENSVRQARWKLFGSALAFILGFSIVFILVLGGIASLLTHIDPIWKKRLSVGFGVIVIVFALHFIGLFRVKAFFKEYRFHPGMKSVGYLGALLAGAAFGFGWSPCLGPIIGSIASLASSSETVATAWLMMILYTLGLAVPFLIAALFVNLFLGSMHKVTRHLRVVEVISGVLLLVMGIFLITNHFTLLEDYTGQAIDHMQRLFIH